VTVYYEINVSLNGRHYFATHERSLTDSEKAVHAYWDLVDRFPKSQGFEVTMTQMKCVGYDATPKRRKKVD
jgi:hypothetical protein